MELSEEHAARVEDKEIRKVAEDKIRERNETDLETLLHLQGREIKSLESEKVLIDKERARDVPR